jgi:hypothetical protein
LVALANIDEVAALFVLQCTTTGGTTKLFAGRHCPAALPALLHWDWTFIKVIIGDHVMIKCISSKEK